MMTRRHLGLALALVATLIATVWAAREQPDPVAAASPPAKARPAAARRDDDDGLEKLLALAPRKIEDDGAEVFRVVAPPAPAQVAQAAPARATAPPLPWRYVGRMEEGGQAVVLLASQGKDITVKRGEIIDKTYRVDEIGPRGIVVTFLPLQQQQTIPVGDGF
jgi:hypothetical protein